MSSDGKEKETKSGRGIIFSSMKMSIAVFISRILGLVREQAMAHYFGASALTDVFLVAYRIPNLLRDLLAEGAFSAAFVPVFAEAKLQGERSARELLWATFILLAVITGVIGCAIYFFAPEFISLFAPSFTENLQKFALAIGLTKIMAPYLFCVSLAALLIGVLNSLKVFFYPALAPAAFNIIMISCTIFLPPFLEQRQINPVYALGIGVLLGGIIQLVLQIPQILKKSYGPLWPEKIMTPLSLKIVKRLGPGLIGFAAAQINILVTTILATGFVGAVSWLNYAVRLFQFPVGIVGVAIGSSHLVHFSESYKANDLVKAKEYLRTSFFFSVFLMIPATAFLLGPAREIVNLVFERGKFLSSDTDMTALMLQCYALSLPFYGVNKIFIPTLYAIEKQKVPVFFSVSSIFVNILFCTLLVPIFGVKILAIGMSLSTLFSSIGCMAFTMKYLQIGMGFFFNRRLLIFLISGILCYCSVLYTGRFVYNFSAPLLLKLLQIIVIGGVGAVTYFIVLFLFGEGQLLRRVLKKS